MTQLIQTCSDILTKNMTHSGEIVYLLYDTESPLARILSDAWISVLSEMRKDIDFSSSSTGTGWFCRNNREKIVIREFKNPPQPLYRGGLINPDNPHTNTQNRIITSHNIEENKRVWLDHHEVYKTTIADPQNPVSLADISPTQTETIDPQIEDIKNSLISLPPGSIAILVQSTNFRLSTFRIRLELFNRGIHVVEFNHLAYIPEAEFDTFIASLVYRTDEYVRVESVLRTMIEKNNEHTPLLRSDKNLWMTRIESSAGDILTFGPLESIRGNTWDYSGIVNKGGTFPIGEVFTEAVDLSSVNGRCLIESFPREDFSVAHGESFLLEIENGRVLPSPHFPPDFARLYDYIVEYEGEVMVRELGMGINPAITTATPLSDINFYERKTWVHLSLGKKHGIYGKKLPKSEIQRFHIDVFIDVSWVWIGDTRAFESGSWSI
jgi:aminopeptidase